MAMHEGLRLACQQMTLQPGLLSAHNALRLFNSSAALSRYRMPMQPPQRPETDSERPAQPELVDRFWAQNCMSSAEKRKESLQEVRKSFQRADGDVGSSEVQVAVLTAKIKAMAEHMKVHRKDYHSRRGLDAMLSQRRSLLQYLRRKDFDSYAITLSRLGLKDNYMKLERAYGQSRAA